MLRENQAVAVFDDVFVSEIERRFANKPRSYHSDIYFVATSPERSGLRHWIEEAVADLPEASRTKVTRDFAARTVSYTR